MQTPYYSVLFTALYAIRPRTGGWTYKPTSASQNCYLHKKMGEAVRGEGCISGGTLPPPPPPGPSTTPAHDRHAHRNSPI